MLNARAHSLLYARLDTLVLLHSFVFPDCAPALKIPLNARRRRRLADSNSRSRFRTRRSRNVGIKSLIAGMLESKLAIFAGYALCSTTTPNFDPGQIKFVRPSKLILHLFFILNYSVTPSGQALTWCLVARLPMAA
ncbi:hypothetical protein L2E82_23246 [Cichorium intybus]|uniref:Uncharacterized protein n=1 Tax=Cichorium intybus TaxID=13427 RepID=A0ACB9E093_CICIN|nr:hypothetical protein L2E82_23246 [Cichorium intybus]